ncbi:MAG: internal scaffolding protein [Microviridae sp.]|nr:MAG: internal scaffolding protein [Microviridae sp.]
MTMFIRSAFNYDVDEASDESGLVCPEPTRTQQQFCEECDINVIVQRFGITGAMPESMVLPTYGDFSGVGDYQSAIDAISQAQEAFMQLPGHIRAKFGHDPGAFVDFCSDEANIDELRSMGLANPIIETKVEPQGE